MALKMAVPVVGGDDSIVGRTALIGGLFSPNHLEWLRLLIWCRLSECVMQSDSFILNRFEVKVWRQ